MKRRRAVHAPVRILTKLCQTTLTAEECSGPNQYLDVLSCRGLRLELCETQCRFRSMDWIRDFVTGGGGVIALSVVIALGFAWICYLWTARKMKRLT